MATWDGNVHKPGWLTAPGVVDHFHMRIYNALNEPLFVFVLTSGMKLGYFKKIDEVTENEEIYYWQRYENATHALGLLAKKPKDLSSLIREAKLPKGTYKACVVRYNNRLVGYTFNY